MVSADTSFTASDSRSIILVPAVGCSILTYLYLWGTLVVHASGGLELAFALFLVTTIVGSQILCIRWIIRDWNTMTTGQRWTTSIAVFVIPLAIVLVLVFLALTTSTFMRAFVGCPPVSASSGFTTSTGWRRGQVQR